MPKMLPYSYIASWRNEDTVDSLFDITHNTELSL